MDCSCGHRFKGTFVKFLVVSTILAIYYGVNVMLAKQRADQYTIDTSANMYGRTILPTRRPAKASCIHPVLQLWPPTFRRYFLKPPPLQCSKTEGNWVYAENGTFRISSAATKRHGAIMCAYTPLLFKTDFASRWGETIADMKSGSPLKSDFFKVECTAKDNSKYENMHAGIVRIQEPTPAPSVDSQRALGLNVMIIGFDSVSRLIWMRMLPKTYDYMVKVLGAVVLEGYNIVGDATTAAMLPMLTGKNEIELPESRRRFKGAKTVDGHPWIWKSFKKLGYVTQMGEDLSKWATFTNRLKGFKNQPSDHYMRTYYLVADKRHSLNKPLCAGSLSRHVVMLNYVRDLYRTYTARTRKFSFMFSVEMTHDDTNLLQLADDGLLAFLKEMNDSGYLDDTVLIMMADHGPRFTKWRESLQGKLEERSPFMSFRFPPSFEKTQPEAMKNLRTNAERLATPFDVHATLQDIANYSGILQGDVKQRGISLLSEIPFNRTCSEAGIAPHWCTCLTWSKMEVGDEKVKKAATAMVASINNMTESLRDKCVILSLADTTRAVRYTPNEGVLKYKGNADYDKYKADLSDKMKNNCVLYQVTIVTKPGNGQYEGTITHQLKENRFDSPVRQISRINKYGDQPHCVMMELPHLRKYCYCKLQIRQHLSNTITSEDNTLEYR